MAARPPPQDSDDPESIEFGIAALAAHLDRADLEYPATADEVVRALGNPKIPCDASGNTVALSEAIDELPRTQFDSKSELLDLLHPVFEEYRASNSGVFERIRSMLPF